MHKLSHEGRDNVHIAPNEPQKFVLVRCLDSDNGQTMVLWGDPTAEWHKDIVKEIADTKTNILEVMGGGRIKLLPELKTIYVWGKSSRYGEAPADEVRPILEGAFPGYALIFGVPSE